MLETCWLNLRLVPSIIPNYLPNNLFDLQPTIILSPFSTGCTMKVRLCELCSADAAVFCPSDAAYLCRRCDAKVHEANFLVARHIRQSVCCNCKNFTGQGISAANCPSCPPADDLGSLSSSGSSVCISSTTSLTKENPGGRGLDSSNSAVISGKRSRPPVDHFKAEGIFVNWCSKIGAEGEFAVRLACKALKVCLDRWTVLPFRVCLAASMLVGMRQSPEKSVVTSKVVKRLEEISGVPVKIILAAGAKLERSLKAGQHLEEGWAENQP